MNTFTALYKSGLGDINLTINGHKVNLISHIVCPQSEVLKMFHERAGHGEAIMLDSNIRANHIDALFYRMYLYDSDNVDGDDYMQRSTYEKFMQAGECNVRFAYYFNVLSDYFGTQHLTLEESSDYSKLIEYLTEPIPVTKSGMLEIIPMLKLIYGGSYAIAEYESGKKYSVISRVTDVIFSTILGNNEDDFTPLYNTFFKRAKAIHPTINLVEADRQEWITEEVLERVAACGAMQKCYYWFVKNADLSVGRKYEILLDLFVKIDKNIRAPYDN
jgi:hypothetical protein